MNRPPGTVITNELRDVDQIRYIAPLGRRVRGPGTSGRPSTSPTSSPTASPSTSASRSTALDPRVTILDSSRARSRSCSRQSAEKQVTVDVQHGAGPRRVDVGETTYTPQVVTVRGAASVVATASCPRA